ncbi:MAG TPA: SGNH/GDSL hydrolase family protein [Candidatus Krumholzibacteria bacterium]|nr:SGNH/GDSL hydrolase family protein [Candidatus Krumholzibacteria bacterium]
MYRLTLAAFALAIVLPTNARSQLPRDPSELLLIGDSVAAGMYFLQLEQASIRQSWTGQLLQRLGIEVPLAPYDHPYPIDHLKLARDGFGALRLGYAWEARRALYPGQPQYDVEEESVLLAIPGQTVGELLTQSTKTHELNESSAGWVFASVILPDDKSVIETVEQWNKRPKWIVVFIGANDLLASYGIVGRATAPSKTTFRAQYAELVDRLRATMAPEAPAEQLIVATLPDVTALPFLQDIPSGVDDGEGNAYPPGTQASTFLIPYRKHVAPDEAWTPDELEEVRQRADDYNDVIVEVAHERGVSVLDMARIIAETAKDPAFSAADSPYFSPDLHHPSYKGHGVIADAMLEMMATIAGEEIPAPLSPPADLLPSARELSGQQARVNALMHLAMQGLQIGPLPRKVSTRFALEAGAQGGEKKIGDGVASGLAGIEGLPVPVTTRHVLRICAQARLTFAAFHSADDDVEFFPRPGLEGRLGLGFEKIGAWNWARFELGGLIAPDDAVDFGLYARQEWRMLYVEAASRGWDFHVEGGIRIGRFSGRPGRNGN